MNNFELIFVCIVLTEILDFTRYEHYCDKKKHIFKATDNYDKMLIKNFKKLEINMVTQRLTL